MDGPVKISITVRIQTTNTAETLTTDGGGQAGQVGSGELRPAHGLVRDAPQGVVQPEVLDDGAQALGPFQPVDRTRDRISEPLGLAAQLVQADRDEAGEQPGGDRGEQQHRDECGHVP